MSSLFHIFFYAKVSLQSELHINLGLMMLTEELRVEGELLHGQDVGTVLDRGIAQPATIQRPNIRVGAIQSTGNFCIISTSIFDVYEYDSEKNKFTWAP